MTEVGAVQGRYTPQLSVAAVADGRCAPACGKISFEVIRCTDCCRRIRFEDTVAIRGIARRVCKACERRREMKETQHALSRTD